MMNWRDKLNAWMCLAGVVFSCVSEIGAQGAHHAWIIGAMGWLCGLIYLEACVDWRTLAMQSIGTLERVSSHTSGTGG